MEEKKYHVYAYLDSRRSGKYNYKIKEGIYHPEFEPFYIGTGKGKRYLWYKKARKRDGKTGQRILKMRKQGNFIKVKVLRKNLIKEQAFSLEEKLIIGIGRQDLKKGPLLNKSDGKGGKNSPLIRKRMREMNLKNWKSEKYRKEMSKKAKKQFRELWKNPEYRKHFSEKRKGEGNNSSKLTEKDVLKMRKLFLKGKKRIDLIKIFNVSKSTVSRVVYRYSWTHI